MKRLIFAVYSDGSNIATHSKEFQCGHQHNIVEDLKEEILESLVETGMEQSMLVEVFLFESKADDAPIIAAHWTAEEGDFDVK